MSQKSKYDPSRDTVGKIYRDLQLMSNKDAVEVGDMSREQMKGYVDDLNDAFKADPFDGQPYYIMIHQKKDLQMRSAILRRVIFTEYRPYPEDDTDVYHFNPKSQEIKFCWSLPHWSEMDNILANPEQFDDGFVWMVRQWKAEDLTIFGFYKHPDLNWMPNPKWKDKVVKADSSNILTCA